MTNGTQFIVLTDGLPETDDTRDTYIGVKLIIRMWEGLMKRHKIIILISCLLLSNTLLFSQDGAINLANEEANNVAGTEIIEAGTPPSFEAGIGGLELSEMSPEQVSFFYLTFSGPAERDDSLHALQLSYAAEKEKFEKAWQKEIGRSSPNLDRIHQSMTPWYGLTRSRAKRQRDVVLEFLQYLEDNKHKLGRLGIRMKKLLMDDIIALSKVAWDEKHEPDEDDFWASDPPPFDGKPDMDNPYVFKRAYTRLLYFVHFREEIFINNEASPLSNSLALPQELNIAQEDGSPWAFNEGVSGEVIAIGANRPDLRDEVLELGVKYDNLLKARLDLAAEAGLPKEKVVPGRELTKTLKATLAKRLATGDMAGYRKLKTAIDNFSKAGRDAQVSEELFFEHVRRAPGNLDNQTTGDTALTDVVVEEVEASEMIKRVRREIMDADLDFDVKFVDLELAKGISISAKYKWELEPSYKDGYHTRIDRYILKSGVSVGEILETIKGKLPVYLNLSSGHEIIFARQFRSKWKAAKALPYTPFKMPLTAKKALELETGDFVSIPVNLTASTGFNIPTPADLIFLEGASSIRFAAGVSYVVAGSSRFNVLRLYGDRVRLRITAIKDKSKNINLSSRFGWDIEKTIPFEFVGLKLLNNLAGELIGKDILKMSATDYDNSLFTWDFIFDLSNKKAVKAYEAIMKATWKLKSLKANLPLKSIEHAKEIFLSDIRPAEALAAAYLDKPEEKRPVVRLFKGGNVSSGKRRRFKFGLKVFNFENNAFVSENRAVSYDELDRAKRFVMPMRSERGAWRLFYGWAKEESERTCYTVVPTDAQWNPIGGLTTVMAYTHRDKKVRRSEIEDHLQQLEASIGRERLTKLCNPAEIAKITKGLYISLTVSIPDTILAKALRAEVPDCKLWAALAKTAQVFPPPNYSSFNDDDEGPLRPYGYSSFPQETRDAIDAIKAAAERENETADWNRIDGILKKMRYLVRNRDTFAKANTFINLAKDSWLKTAMMRMLIELTLPYVESEDDIFIHLRVEGKEIKTIDKSIGTDTMSDLYQLVQDISYSVNDNSLKMR